jgi:hypothetical protein
VSAAPGPALQRDPDAEEPEAPVVEVGVVDRRHPAAVVVERLVIAPAVIDAAPGLVRRGRRSLIVPAGLTGPTWPAGRGSLIVPAGRGSLIVPTRRGSLVGSAGSARWRTPWPLAIPELARWGTWLRGRDPGAGGQRRPADDECDRRSPGQTLEIHDQPPFEAREDHVINIDCGRLSSGAMGELWCRYTRAGSPPCPVNRQVNQRRRDRHDTPDTP